MGHISNQEIDMNAGFSRVEITPPLGTPLMGWGVAAQRLSTGVHDPLHVRALALQQGEEIGLIIGLDLCFVGRDDNDRIHGLLGRELGLLPRQVLLSATHTHAAPAVGIYLELEWAPPLRSYLRQLDQAILDAARQAIARLEPATLQATMGRTALPMNRRRLTERGITNAPNPAGPIYDRLPICLLRNRAGQPICLLFAASTHPVCFSGTLVSADYPGAAMRVLDEKLGLPCSLFLQGMAGDSRPRTLEDGARWRANPGGAETERTGRLLAEEVGRTLENLRDRAPQLRFALHDSCWPLQPLTLEAIGAMCDARPACVPWAQALRRGMERGTVRSSASILMHGVQLARDVRLVAIEGEPLHPYGAIIENGFNDGVTLAVGYTGGEGMYLVTTPMLAEGGYEPESFWEYHQPGPLAPGMEQACLDGIAALRSQGIV